MIREWLVSHRNALAAGVSGTAIVSVIGAAAILSGGYTAQRIDLGDGAVWVANASRQVVGRANTQVFELNTVVDTASNTIDVVQRGSTVLVNDTGSSAVDIVDAATSDVSATVPLPPDDPHVALAGSDVVITADGDVWTSSLAALADFQSASTPKLSLGTGTVTSIDDTGRLFAFTPATGLLVQVDVATGAVTSSTTIRDVTADDTFTLTSAGGRWALLDATMGTIDTAAGRVSLGSGRSAGAVLQQASSADADAVLIAHDGGLLSLPLGGGQPSSLVDGRSGDPAAPIVIDGCSYAAWADGTAWQRCSDRDGTTSALGGARGSRGLAFRTNNHSVVLNDTSSGSTWAVQDDNRLIDNWDELINEKRTDQVVEENDQSSPPELQKAEEPPVAVDDRFGARPGRSTVLPVLLNDFDPNGDVLVISAVNGPDTAVGRVDTVANAQQLQLTLPADASGQVRFGYTITDGRGGSASASVTVDVRTPDENSPPTQVRTTRASVEAGGRVTNQVLSDWVDPDGDAMYLANATVPDPDKTAFKPDGTVVFSSSPGGSGAVSVGLTVSDGRAEGAGTLAVTVLPVGEVPIVAEGFIVQVTAGEETTVAPLDHVRGGNGVLRLASVPGKPDVTITPDFDGGTFRFSSGSIGTHYLDYSVTDGVQNATGIVRVDVSAPPNGPTTPITVPHVAYVHTQSTGTIDPVATDIDPTGGVLLVTGVTTPDARAGFRVEILEQHLLRITLTGPLEGGQATFGYRVSNGLAEADGSVTVIEVPRPARRQAPIARPDTASVRVGDVIDIPVLDNDEQPDGDPLTLDGDLGGRPAGSGLLFASGRVLRYLAPSKPGNYTAVYRVDAPDGQFASAEVKISVREADPASNNPPVPRTVTARVLAGETVRIPIPLTGIDPDGDSVQLLGQETNPQKGSVIDSGPGWLDYQSGEYSGGTDTFSYSVIDSLGARATGIIRVGISARLDGARGPVAVEDTVIARPGGTVLARVLDNDSNPDGGALTITAVEPTSQGTATVDGDVVRVKVPGAEGDYGFIYTVQNAQGATSSNFLTVRARADAPLSRPIASDTVLTLSDVLDRSSIDVNVLANVFFADGPASSLKLSVLPGYDTATVTSSGKVRVRVGDDSQIIPFAVANPRDPSIVGYAFIWVPGYNDALPQLRKGVGPLNVVSEATLTIDINKYVVAVGGKKVRLTDSGTVRASHANGSDLVVDQSTLRFTSVQEYFGPASISFEVTDGSSADDPNGRTATIVLPISVTPRQNQPPSFTGGVIDFEPEQSKTINLTRLTNYPYPDDRAELTYTVLDPPPVGFSVSLDGQSMKITADSSAQKGAQTAVAVGVRDDLNAGTSGRILLRVVPSTRPIAVPAPDSAIAPRGQTTTVDVLANDAAGNPFPSTPLTVVAVRGLDAASLPSGVSIVPSADRSSLRVTVSSNAAPVDTNLQYQVADATGDPDRYAWGTVRISVQDRPDPVTALQVTGYGDRNLTVAFQPAAFNNSPITGYTVSLVGIATGSVVGSTECASTTCVVPTPGNGEANAVRVQVVAKNGIGSSDPTLTADAVWSDIVPPAPTGIAAAPLDGGLRISWDAVTAPSGATPVRSYVVTVAGTALGEFTASDICSAGRCSIDQGGLANGSSVPFTISARNGAYPALSAWTSASGAGVPFGPPIAGGIRVDPDPASGAVTVSWDAFNGNGDPVNGYFVQRLADGSPPPGVPSGASACSVSSPAPGSVTGPSGNAVVAAAGATSARITGLTGDNTNYNFVVWGFNRSGCVPTVVGSSVVRPGPGDITAVASQMVDSGYTRDLVVNSVSSAGGAARFGIRLLDGSGSLIPGAQTTFNGQGTPRVMFSRPWGETIRFQVRACSAWGTCGSWSRTLPDDAQPSLTWELPSAQYDPQSAIWSWTNAPDNGADHPASFSCGIEGQAAVPAGTATSCIIPGAVAGQPVWLGITIDGTTKRYTQ